MATMLSNQSGTLPALRQAYDTLDVIAPALAKAPYGIGCWLEDFDPKTGQTNAISSGGGFGCMPFLDLKRNVAGVLLPHNRKWKLDTKGRRYNDAHRVASRRPITNDRPRNSLVCSIVASTRRCAQVDREEARSVSRARRSK